MTALEQARALAREGLAVFPCHSIAADGSCTCGRATCDRPGKHPRTPHGLKDATTDEATITAWWAQGPDANVAVRTGDGLLVLDVDPAHGGGEALAALQMTHGALPVTRRVVSGGGGEHYWFRVPGDRRVRNSTSKLGPGLDVRGEGGYVIAPPSRHCSGGRYGWASDSAAPIAPCPAWLLDALDEPPRAEATPAPEGARIPMGRRNSALTSVAGAMRRRGLQAEAIEAALLVVNAQHCDPPLPDLEVHRIARSVGRYPPTVDPSRPGTSAWERAKPVDAFLAEDEAVVECLEERLLVRGAVTLLAAPRGLGKTLVAHAIAVKLARLGYRVLLLDRDNPPRVLRQRLRGWHAEGLTTLEILTRDDAPPLWDAATWAQYPTGAYDLIILDSIDAATEGAGEKDSAKPAALLARFLDIVRQEDGPAGLVLGNTVRSGAHSRGSGVIEDRLDIVYEVRDATGFVPAGSLDWWLELPPAGADEWGDRARRRHQRDQYRLAFVPSKFRVAEEPEPFVLELNLSGERWELRDVTEEVIAEAALAHKQAVDRRAQTRKGAIRALRDEVARRAAAQEPEMLKGDAVPFLMGQGLSQKAAREILEDLDGLVWAIEEQANVQGRPKVLRPVEAEVSHAGNGKVTSPDGRIPSGDSRVGFRSPHGARPTETKTLEAASAAEFQSVAVSVGDKFETRATEARAETAETLASTPRPPRVLAIRRKD